MKKYEKLFLDKEKDSILIPLLIRSMKETGFKPKSVEGFIKQCMDSRSSHLTEPFYVNASYWPKDTSSHSNSYPALFVARIINMNSFSHDDFNSSLVSNFLQYVESFDITYVRAFKEIYLAIKKTMGHTRYNYSLFLKKLEWFSQYIDLKSLDYDPITPCQI